MVFNGVTRLWESWQVADYMEHRAGIEPANTGFADQRVSHFATGALVPPRPRRGGDFQHILLRLWGRAQVRLDRFVAREEIVCLFVGDGSSDDDVFTLLPVRGRRYSVLRRWLNGIDDA